MLMSELHGHVPTLLTLIKNQSMCAIISRELIENVEKKKKLTLFIISIFKPILIKGRLPAFNSPSRI